MPLVSFASPAVPLASCHVSDNCWDQIHGVPHTPDIPTLPSPSFPRHKSPSLCSSSATRFRPHLSLPPALDRSYGELDAYPLRHPSVLCKATGGGRWQPKPSPPIIGYRPPIPGAKAQYELDLECAELAARTRRESPIVKHGDFQYRFPPPSEQALL
ncbi:hypothetical protein H0H87_001401 [Tephrocybe sp. NHM501043]|nr:hypothetical protein H0H87_001401 [Tephrocybe sp. NHM501043]